MADREKLVWILGEFLLWPTKMKDVWMPKGIEKLADHLIAHGVTVQGAPDANVGHKWIPVKERLPEDGQSVLTCKNGICDIQIYEKRRNGWLCKGWFWSMATVTHWMPLPKPPKGQVI